MPWRTTDGKVIAAKGQPELSILIEGIFDKRRLLDLLHDFTVFGETGSGLAKIIAGYHQFHAVRHAVEKTVEASAPQGDRKGRRDLAHARFGQEPADGVLRRPACAPS